MPIISLLAGLAVGKTLQSLYGLQPRLKWPNDVFLNGRKICGILVEMKQVCGAPRLAVGIGLNCLGAPADFPADVRGLLTTLSHELGSPVDMEAALQEVLASLQREYLRLLGNGKSDDKSAGKSALLSEWSELAELAGRTVRYPTPQGLRRGQALGLSPEGYLLIATEEGDTHVHASGELIWEA